MDLVNTAFAMGMQSIYILSSHQEESIVFCLYNECLTPTVRNPTEMILVHPPKQVILNRVVAVVLAKLQVIMVALLISC